jgi:sugar phosphate isomerase/epimerase
MKPDVLLFKIDLLNRILERADELGIEVCIENLSERVSDLEDALNRLPLLNLTLDLGHAQILTKKNTSHEFIEKYPDRIKHIHIHDNRGGNSPRDDLHLPVGDGIIDFISIFKGLGSINYQRTMTLELKPSQIRKCLSHVKDLLGK